MLIFIGVGKIEIYLEGSDEQYFLEGSGEVQFGVERKVFPKYFPSKKPWAYFLHGDKISTGK